MKYFEVLQESLKEEHSFHLIFFLLWQFNCVKHSCLNLSLPGFANKDTPNSVCAEYPFCMTLGTGNFANVWAFCPIVLSPLYQCHQCFGPISASRLLSLPSRKRPDSDSNEVDEDPKAFISKWLNVLFLQFSYNGLDSFWLISLFGMSTFFTIKLKAGTKGAGSLSGSLRREPTA